VKRACLIGIAKPATISSSPSSWLGQIIGICGFSLLLCIDLKIAPSEVGSIAPHTMHDNGEFSCQRDVGLF